MKKILFLVLVVFGFGALLRSVVLPRFGLDFATVLPAVVALLTNTARAKLNLNSLTTDPLLTLAAQAKANDMAANGYFAHTSPNGRLPWYWIDKAGYKYVYAGENLAVDFGESEKLVDAWMNSPTHKQNIVNPHYTDIGIGTADGMYKGHKATFVVQMFASPSK